MLYTAKISIGNFFHYNTGHDLVLIANYLVREHVKTDGKTSKL
jgi:hypothetical protein|nr:MAG TPA: hypothetical protein [Caudoviricetes sp.]